MQSHRKQWTGVCWQAGLLLGVVLLLPGASRANSLTVGCPGGNPGQFPSITAALAQLDPRGPNTITVSGACNENVMIASFDRLTLVGQGNASVTDNSGGTAGVITIGDSQRVSIQGLTINGGGFGVACWDHSLCRFSGNTIQGAMGSGVIVTDGSHADFNGDVIQNNASVGVDLFSASEVRMNGATIQGNRSFAAAFVRLDSYFDIHETTIQDNLGTGVLLGSHGTMRLIGSTISSNLGNGIVAMGNSLVQVGAGGAPGHNTIQLNGGSGVVFGDLSFGTFISGQIVVTGNKSGLDVACNPQFSATRGATTNIGGGTTNCKEPVTPSDSQ